MSDGSTERPVSDGSTERPVSDGGERRGSDGGRGARLPRTNVATTVLVVGLLVAAVIVDRDVATPDPASRFGPAAPTGPVAPPPDALGSTWYCPFGLSEPDGVDDGSVIIANPGEVAVAASVVIRANDGDEAHRRVDVPALGSASIELSDVTKARRVSVEVRVGAGTAVVEHSVVGEGGRSVTSCSPNTSTAWYLAAGVTARDAAEVVALSNPYPDDAIVDFTFATNEGVAEPQALSGLVVHARSTRFVRIHEHVRRRNHVAATVVARVGRFVLDRVQTFDGRQGREGIALSLGAMAPATSWWVPDGQAGEGIDERLVVYNPTGVEASVDVELRLAKGEAEPYELAVPPGGYEIIDPEKGDRVPGGVAHGAIVRSVNGVAVVVERLVYAGEGSARRGVSYVVGSTLQAEQWVLADGRATDAVDEWVVILNPESVERTVSLFGLVGGQRLPLADLQDLRVRPLGRMAIRLGEHVERDELAVLVAGDGPIVVERGLYAVGATGMSAAIGVPLRGE